MREDAIYFTLRNTFKGIWTLLEEMQTTHPDSQEDQGTHKFEENIVSSNVVIGQRHHKYDALRKRTNTNQRMSSEWCVAVSGLLVALWQQPLLVHCKTWFRTFTYLDIFSDFHHWNSAPFICLLPHAVIELQVRQFLAGSVNP